MTSGAPAISVITRTLGKAPFLKRVLASLAAAAPEGTEWLIVDDGAENEQVLAEIVEQAKAFSNLAPVLVHSGSRHRAKAMNAGLAAATGGLIHILDDDDTISPGFYSECSKVLEDHPECNAVAVRCEMVEEIIELPSAALREVRRTPHFPEIEAISIATMLVQQVTPTCSLLFRAGAMHGIGLFNVQLPVCEDYEFLLRFLLEHDITLIDKRLATFHTRSAGSAEAFRNSEASVKHAQVDATFRNALLRRSVRDPEDKLGMLLLMGDLARGATKIDRATVFLRKNRLWSWIYSLVRSR